MSWATMTWWDDLLQRTLHRGLLHEIREIGARIMAEIDDLKAALDGVGTKVDEVAAEVTAVDTEVKDLIAKLGSVPPTPSLAAAIAQAQAVSTRLGAVSDALKAIPPEPTA